MLINSVTYLLRGFGLFFGRNRDANVVHFDTIPECDGQTDGRVCRECWPTTLVKINT